MRAGADYMPCFLAGGQWQLSAGAKKGYEWGGNHWHETTWNKVRVIFAIYELGFNVIHSDTDVTWFKVWKMTSDSTIRVEANNAL